MSENPKVCAHRLALPCRCDATFNVRDLQQSASGRMLDGGVFTDRPTRRYLEIARRDRNSMLYIRPEGWQTSPVPSSQRLAAIDRYLPRSAARRWDDYGFRTVLARQPVRHVRGFLAYFDPSVTRGVGDIPDFNHPVRCGYRGRPAKRTGNDSVHDWVHGFLLPRSPKAQ